MTGQPPAVQDRSLDGQIALITGASRGIGRATALRLATMGAHCVITARTQGGLCETDDLIAERTGRRATLLPLDLADGGKTDLLGPSLAERFGRLDILIHAAARFVTPTPLDHIRETDWTRALTVNLSATMRLIRTATPLLRQAPAGRAVILTNRDLNTPAPFHGIGAACGAGVDALVSTWQQEMAGCPSFTACLFDPGPTATRLRAQTFPAEESTALLATPESVAARIAALCAVPAAS
ncbi:SDR family NAD(P)-dependent oxidoreductase [Acetobacter oeni]|uniref:Short-chain dehydrogenase n=2 Tax=Acetobacter oeni TaxID=304077 RepID=A0A511XLE7_9PROT|nr:SDR family oxidoreductase [Acetobacter oeni]MBB3883550.1 NAD(P)-dependent dehydrogenase (short-subunit alcohol dehydrogenase family) [Acetobacter oeni]NHO19587.1 SDR family NAD(P)-dependent oxidoreductase [Acetobacter oeni]GEN63771.1 short-chain dehydrogenase [Acetobacter oeni]